MEMVKFALNNRIQKLLVLQVFWLVCLGIYSQASGRLDLRPGFREFKFKTPKELYLHFPLHKTDFYHWPEILEVYSLRYGVQIGNTRTDSLHIFFLGNQLVRATVFLQDTLTNKYLEKNFGKSMLVGESYLDEATAISKLKNNRLRYFYVVRNQWNADMVRMETKRMYKLDENQVKQVDCMDFYLIDFRDMMNVFSLE